MNSHRKELISAIKAFPEILRQFFSTSYSPFIRKGTDSNISNSYFLLEKKNTERHIPGLKGILSQNSAILT